MKLTFKKEWFFWIALIAIFLSINYGIKNGLYWTLIFVLGMLFFFYSYYFFDILFYEKDFDVVGKKKKSTYLNIVMASVLFIIICFNKFGKTCSNSCIINTVSNFFSDKYWRFVADKISEKRNN